MLCTETWREAHREAARWLLSCRRVNWVCDHHEWWKIDTELWNSLLLGIVFLAKQLVTEKKNLFAPKSSQFRGQQDAFPCDIFKNQVKTQMTKLFPLLTCRLSSVCDRTGIFLVCLKMFHFFCGFVTSVNVQVMINSTYLCASQLVNLATPTDYSGNLICANSLQNLSCRCCCELRDWSSYKQMNGNRNTWCFWRGCGIWQLRVVVIFFFFKAPVIFVTVLIHTQSMSWARKTHFALVCR